MGIENIGTQDAFEGFAKSSQQMGESSNMFKSSAGMFVAGIMAFDATSKRMGDDFKDFRVNTISQLKNWTKDIVKIFSVATIVDTIADLGNQLVDIRVALGKEMGITKDNQFAYVKALTQQNQLVSDYGVSLDNTYESYSALYSEFRNLKSPLDVKDLVSTTDLLSGSLGLASSESASLVSSLSFFANKDGKQIEEWTESVSTNAHQQGVNYKAVAKQLSASAKHMYRFNATTKGGLKNIEGMAIYAEKLGVDLESVLDATDKFRTFQGAMEASVTASRFGLQMDPRSLMASARGGDATMALKSVIGTLQGFIDPVTKNLSQLGIDVADQLAPIVGLDREEMVMAMERIQRGDITVEGLVNLRDEMKANRLNSEILKDSMTSLMNKAVWPVVLKFLPSINKGVQFLSDKILELSGPMKKFGENFIEAVSPIVSALQWGFNLIIKPIGGILKWALQNETLLKTLVGGAMAFFAVATAYYATQTVTKGIRGVANVVGGAKSLGANLFMGPTSTGSQIGKMLSDKLFGGLKGTKEAFRKGNVSRWKSHGTTLGPPPIPNPASPPGTSMTFRNDKKPWVSGTKPMPYGSGVAAPQITPKNAFTASSGTKPLSFNQQTQQMKIGHKNNMAMLKEQGMQQNQMMQNQVQSMKAQTGNMLASAVRMIAFAGAIWVLSKAFQNLSKLSWNEIAKGGAVMAGFATTMTLMSKFMKPFEKDIWRTVIVMSAFAGSILVLSLAFQNMMGLDWKSMATAAGSLIVFGAAAALMGTYLLAPILLGSGAIIVLSAAIAVFGQALKSVAPFMEPFAKGMGIVIDSISFGVAGVVTAIGESLRGMTDSLTNFILALKSISVVELGTKMGIITGSQVSIGAASVVDGFGKILGGVGNIIGGEPKSPLTSVLDLRTVELTNAISRLTAAMSTQKEYIPVTIETEVKLDSDVLVRHMSNRTLNVIPSRG